ncbi:MAG: tRNA uridine-5-carboxymethylaminomethyl(34) synthesis enzyme MnmG [Proteobacteria bacterium]|nr:tRNA uridine-5-carboxymethylaminomethyl(34) synthesis enzyme MnmG [Pseudomonadota bacterium]
MSTTIHYPLSYDAIVVGGGHAGCEAAWALAQSGCRVLLIALSLDRIAQMSCNPSIGGIAKGHLTKEIDALGGLMARIADASAIQYRTLNASKGPAVRSSRVQCDVALYCREMLRRLSSHPNIALAEAKVEDILIENGAVTGVLVSGNIVYHARTVVLCTGTFMRGICHIGEYRFEAGRSADGVSERLSDHLARSGVRFMRLKTGTPARLSAHSLDYMQFTEQPGDDDITRLSFYEMGPMLPQRPCHIASTTPQTHAIIHEARERSPLFNGQIQGIGARYCPSIEDKIYRFADKAHHQIFIEPMGLDTDEVYPAGISSSLPFDIQLAFLHSIPGFERAHVTRPAYAVEYDALASGQMSFNMALRTLPSLFVAGQINGTSGYEEAAAQGLMAGLNAAAFLQQKDPFILRRDEAYIGVMIDDLIMRGVDEPYRMFTSRAEFRLSLREDNADLRLSDYGHQRKLLTDTDYETFRRKKEHIETLTQWLQDNKAASLDRTQLTEDEQHLVPTHGTLAQLIKMPEVTLDLLARANPTLAAFPPAVRRSVEIQAKFDGYIRRETSRIEAFVTLENRLIPPNFNYDAVHGLTTEALAKLKATQPRNFSEASRIPSMTPAALNAIWVAMKR